MANSISVFIDDSKDANAEKYIIAAAVVGCKSDWNFFNKAWAKALRDKPAIEYFHANEWRGMRKQFAQFREDGKCTENSKAAANSKREALVEVIKCHVKAVSVTLDVQDWCRAVADHPRPGVISEVPYKTALQELFHAVAKGATVGRHKLKFVCDGDNQAKNYQQMYSNFRVKNPKTAKKIERELMFADDTKIYGLQAADLVAHTINQIHKQHGLSDRDQPPPIELAGLMVNAYIWDYKRGMAVLDSQTIDV